MVKVVLFSMYDVKHSALSDKGLLDNLSISRSQEPFDGLLPFLIHEWHGWQRRTGSGTR